MLCLQYGSGLPHEKPNFILFHFFFFQNKLDGYIKEEESGKELSSEQQKAIEKYDEVIQQLSLSKEFCKQFQLIANTASKEAKRDAKKVSESWFSAGSRDLRVNLQTSFNLDLSAFFFRTSLLVKFKKPRRFAKF